MNDTPSPGAVVAPVVRKGVYMSLPDDRAVATAVDGPTDLTPADLQSVAGVIEQAVHRMAAIRHRVVWSAFQWLRKNRDETGRGFFFWSVSTPNAEKAEAALREAGVLCDLDAGRVDQDSQVVLPVLDWSTIAETDAEVLRRVGILLGSLHDPRRPEPCPLCGDAVNPDCAVIRLAAAIDALPRLDVASPPENR